MSLTAVHPERGRLDATQPDLGCDWDWTAIHRVQPPAPLTCPECGHGMHAKVSSLKMRFFAHAPGYLACTLAGESMAHHLLKLELATAARAAGWVAELEVSGPGGHWRADVLASSADGRRVALEAQLATITVDDITARTEHMAADGVRACWFSDRGRIHWLGTVPSMRVARRDGDLLAVEPLARFAAEDWSSVGAVPLVQFLGWLLADKVVWHCPQKAPKAVWTARQYIKAEREEGEQWMSRIRGLGEPSHLRRGESFLEYIAGRRG